MTTAMLGLMIVWVLLLTLNNGDHTTTKGAHSSDSEVLGLDECLRLVGLEAVSVPSVLFLEHTPP